MSNHRTGAIIAVAGLAFAIPRLHAQQDRDSLAGSRGMINRKFLEMRKEAPARPAADKAPDSLVGFTVWKLRPSKVSDDQGARMLVQGDGGTEEWTPERYDLNSSLPRGEKVRLSIETTRAGYLYVIDREQYADGSYGDPMLIFPTLASHGGDNRVRAGAITEIPSPDDKLPYFRVIRSRPDHVHDVLTVLVTPEPIEGIEIRRTAIKLTPGQFAEWEKKWATQVQQVVTSQRTGSAYTAAEKRAGQKLGRLSESDAPPGTIYDCMAKAGEPLLVNIPLKLGN